MEKPPCCVLKLSLKDIALRRVAVILWNGSDILDSIAKIQFRPKNYRESKRDMPEVIEGKVKDKLSKLVLPDALKKQIVNLVIPIGSEIRGWKSYHEKYLIDSSREFYLLLLQKLCWTSLGTIDYRKTAEELIRLEMIGIVNRYKLACLYFFEDDIPGFWEELPEEMKRFFYNGSLKNEEPYVACYWPYVLKEEQPRFLPLDLGPSFPRRISYHEHAFQSSAVRGNKTAVEYFFRKLTNEEIEPPLARTARNVLASIDDTYGFPSMEKHADVFIYLLSLMTTEQQVEVIKTRPCHALRYFLQWPWQDLFFEITHFIWTIFPESHYDQLVFQIIDVFFITQDYIPKLFQDFFIHSPVGFRQTFVHRKHLHNLFRNLLFDKKDYETLGVIFRNIDVDDRVKLFSSPALLHCFIIFIRSDKWDVAEQCLREAMLSTEGADGLRKAFIKFLAEDDRQRMFRKEWKRVFQLLDEIYSSATSKRSSEVETPTVAKKLFHKE